jgi:hypothetical protein
MTVLLTTIGIRPCLIETFKLSFGSPLALAHPISCTLSVALQKLYLEPARVQLLYFHWPTIAVNPQEETPS